MYGVAVESGGRGPSGQCGSFSFGGPLLDELPGAIRLATGRAVGFPGAATDGRRLLIFSAITADRSLNRSLRRNFVPRPIVRRVPVDCFTFAGMFECLTRTRNVVGRCGRDVAETKIDTAPMVIVPVTVADPMLALGVAVAKAAEIAMAAMAVVAALVVPPRGAVVGNLLHDVALRLVALTVVPPAGGAVSETTAAMARSCIRFFMVSYLSCRMNRPCAQYAGAPLNLG